MQEIRYKVTTDGQFADGCDPSDVKQRVSDLFKAPQEKINRLFSGQRVVIKDKLDHATAIKYQNALRQAGLSCQIIRQNAPLIVNVKPASDRMEGEQASPEAIYMAGLPPADLKPRILAGLYTFFLVLCLYVPLRLPIAAYLHFKYAGLFNNIEKIGGTTGALITQMRQANAMFSEFGTYQAIGLLLVVLFLMVLIPLKTGRTWGQKKMGLMVVNRENRIARGFVPVILRLISAGAAVATLGGVFLIALIHPNKKSLADLLSGTRQVRYSLAPKRPVSAVLVPFALAAILSVVIAYPTGVLLTPPVPPAGRIAAEKKHTGVLETAMLPDFKISPILLKPMPECGPIIILHWQESVREKTGNSLSYLNGNTSAAPGAPSRSMFRQLFEKEELHIIYTENGVDVCLVEPDSQDIEELFSAENIND